MGSNTDGFARNFVNYFNSNKPSSDELKRRLRVSEELRDAGFTARQVSYVESKRLTAVISDDEHVMAAICGHAPKSGKAIIAATSRRVIYVDHRPFLDILDEFNYVAISGISYSTNGFFWSITMHSSLGDRILERIKGAQAKKFVNYVESMCINQPYGG